ncbi:hypothetical protein PINS_up023134 [Pythium insidiosum]|nr:hypothetical protein PINS_up009714 [Pythium insidiosum]GLE10862.1 hypothetical protein PINS_up023134 [Pythium insidiosum]
MRCIALGLIHVACALLLTVVTLLYALPRLHAFTVELCSTYLPCLDERHDTSVAFLHACLALSHGLAVMRLLPTRTAAAAATTTTPRGVFGCEGLFGVEYPGFNAVYAARKCVQIVLQFRQAYYASLQMSRDWLNHMYVISIVVNCWATPVLLLLPPIAPSAGVASRRCAALMLDAVLDFVAMVCIPSVLLASSVRSFDFETFDFRYDAWYDAMWFVNMTRELQLLVVRSAFDLAYRVVFGANLLLCLDTIKSLLLWMPPSLLRTCVQPDTVAAAATALTPAATRSRSTLSLFVTGVGDAQTVHVPSTRWKRLVSVGFVLWGLAITVVTPEPFVSRIHRRATCL